MLEIMCGLLFLAVIIIVIFVAFLIGDYRVYRKRKAEYASSGKWYDGSAYSSQYRAPSMSSDVRDSASASLFYAILASIVLIPLIFLGGSQINQRTLSSGVELASMQDGSATKGSFFLGSGYVDERPVYRYYAKVYDSYYYEQVPASRSTVKYTTDAPQKITYEKCGSLPWTVNICSEKTYLFLVPEGTVASDYSLDAK